MQLQKQAIVSMVELVVGSRTLHIRLSEQQKYTDSDGVPFYEVSVPTDEKQFQSFLER